ncbi:putative S-layer protein [Candidatus Woesearchaeota archaeon]|nr:putative S-layer protein [Candidatus Woesearchaeota archaeon]
MYKKFILGIFAVLVGLFLVNSAIATVTIDFGDDDEVSFNEDSSDNSLDLDEYINDDNLNGTLSIDYSGNDHIDVSISSGNIVTFTPEADWHGTETITFTVDDDDATSDSDDFKVTVNSVNDAPTFDLPKTLKATVDVAYSEDLNEYVTDVDDVSHTFTAETEWETFPTDISDGTIFFTPTEIDVGFYNVYLTVSDGEANVSDSVRFWIKEICDDGSLVIDEVEIDDNTGDDDQTEPGDKLDIEFEINNKLTEDIDDVDIEVWIEDEDGDEVAEEVETEINTIDSKDHEDAEVTLQIEPDVDKGTYYLVIEAKGEDEDNEDRCDVYYEEIKIEKEDHRLLIDSVTFVPSEVKCGGQLEVSTKLYNVGEEDQDDVKLKVILNDLNVEESTQEFELDDGDDVVKKLMLDIPKSTEAGEYFLEVVATFNDGDDTAASEMIPFTVTCDSEEEGELISGASVLEAETTKASADIGETIKFTTILTNNGETATTYTISLNDVSAWAESIVEPSTITLAPGSEIPVYVYITPKSASTHTAILSVYADGELAANKIFTIDVTGGETVTGAAGIETTEWGHQISTSQTKALIKDYIGTTGLIVLIALLVTLGFVLFAARNLRRPEVIYEGKKRSSKRK